MKKVKYLIAIIIIGIVAFIGIEFFRKGNNEQIENNEINNVDYTQPNNDIEQINTTPIVELTNGQELLEKAEKTLTARGWAGASNNVIGLKDGIVYYYNKGNGKFRKIATGIDSIYYKTDDSEEITVQKTDTTEIIGEIPQFLIFE